MNPTGHPMLEVYNEIPIIIHVGIMEDVVESVARNFLGISRVHHIERIYCVRLALNNYNTSCNYKVRQSERQ